MSEQLTKGQNRSGGCPQGKIKPWPAPPRPSNAIEFCLKPFISQPVYEKRHFLRTLIRFDANLAGTESKCVTQRHKFIARAGLL